MYRYQNFGRYRYIPIPMPRYLADTDTDTFYKIMKLLLFLGLNRCTLQLFRLYIRDMKVTRVRSNKFSLTQMTKISIICLIFRYFSKKYRKKYWLFETDTNIHRYISSIYCVGKKVVAIDKIFENEIKICKIKCNKIESCFGDIFKDII